MAFVAIRGQTGSGSGDAALDVQVYSSLPAAVADNQLAIIAANAPALITIDTVQPGGPDQDDVWVQMASLENVIGIENQNTVLNIRPNTVFQYRGSFWRALDAYIGASGEWVQVSSYRTQMGISYRTVSVSPVLTRLGAAVGKNAEAGVGPVAQVSDFDDMPIYRDIRLCNLAADGTVNAYEGDAGFTRLGTNGDVMVEIPAFWYKIVIGVNTEEWWISNGPADGFAKHPAFADCDAIYVSAYEADAGYASKTGVQPLSGITRAAARTACQAKGDGWSQLDIAAIMAVNLLIYIEYASLDIQTAIGDGVTNLAAAVDTGGCDGMAGHTGSSAVPDKKVPMKWRHIENWYGNRLKFADGINIDGGVYYFCTAPEKYTDSLTADYTAAGYTVGTNLSASYVKVMGYDADHPWLRMPITGSASATTYYCDGVYTSTGLRTACFGGYYSLDTISGPAAWNMRNAASYSSGSLGARLVYRP